MLACCFAVMMLIGVTSGQQHVDVSRMSGLMSLPSMNEGLKGVEDNNPGDPGTPSNGTIVVDMPQGGVAFTIVTNLSVGLVFFILFILFRPFIPLFNLKEKSRLMKLVKENIRASNNYINYKDKGGDIFPTVDEDILERSSIINKVRGETKFETLLDLKEETKEDEDMEEIDTEASNITSSVHFQTDFSLSDSTFSPINTKEDTSNVGSTGYYVETRSRKVSAATPYQTTWQRYQAGAIIFLRDKWTLLAEFMSFAIDVLLSFVSKNHDREDMERLLTKYSRDVAVYLLFQKKFISAMFIITLLCSVVLLPIHLTQQTDVNSLKFEFNGYTVAPSDYPLLRTTISMVLDSPLLLLIHVFLSFVVSFIFALFLLKFIRHDVVTKENYGKSNMENETTMLSTYSVLVQDLPADFNSEPQFQKMVKGMYNQIL